MNDSSTDTSRQLAIRARGLGKTYRSRRAGQVQAVQDLDLTVPAGQIFGLLGPNGAGKTTTIRMLSGLIRPSCGTVHIEGFSVHDQPNEVRRRIGLVPEDAGDHKNLTLAEELEYHGALYGLDRATVRHRSRPLIERLELGDRTNHLLKTFSRGMRRKFHLIRALLHQPRVLLLDEPTAGLDPAIAEEVWHLLKGLAVEHQVTVILCSHHLEEVEKLCDQVAILRQRLLVSGSVRELQGGDRRYRIELDEPAGQAVEILKHLGGLEQVEGKDAMLYFSVLDRPRETVPRVVQCLVESGQRVLEVTRDSRDLRSLYRSVMDTEDKRPGGEP